MSFLGVGIQLTGKGEASHAQRAVGGVGKLRRKGSEAGVVEATGHGELMRHLQELAPYSVNTHEPQTEE